MNAVRLLLLSLLLLLVIHLLHLLLLLALLQQLRLLAPHLEEKPSPPLQNASPLNALNKNAVRLRWLHLLSVNAELISSAQHQKQQHKDQQPPLASPLNALNKNVVITQTQ